MLILNLAVFDLLLAIVGVLLRGPAMVDTDFFQLHPFLEGICKVDLQHFDFCINSP